VTDATDDEPGGTDTEPDETNAVSAGPDDDLDEPAAEPVETGRPRLPAPPTYVLARSAVAGATVVLAVVGVIAVLHRELPVELLELVAHYFDWLFGLVG
jgi:hypothetical protein